jgi:DNA-binding transcriptional regulator YhcF (GntR family)
LDIRLNRRGGVPVRDQLVTQLEMKILSGALAPGERLPSVRALARRLDVHHNTVSAAYGDLQAAGHVLLQRGSGVFVRKGGPTGPEEAESLDQMIRLALHLAFRRGYSGQEIRSAVERWIAAAPPDRVVVVDPEPPIGALLVHEIRQSMGARATSCTLAELEHDPSLLSGALALTLPYHQEAFTRLMPEAAVEVLTLTMSEADRQAIQGLPANAIVLVVSHCPTVLPFASVLLRTLRGEDALVEARLLSEPREWRRLVPAADIVFADALSSESVGRARPKKLREFRLIAPASLERLRDALMVVLPRMPPPSRKRRV